MQVAVRVEDQSGPLLSTGRQHDAASTAVFEDLDHDAEPLIARIIADNTAAAPRGATHRGDALSMAQPPGPAPFAPLGWRAAGRRHHRAVAGHLHERAGHHHRQRGADQHRRRSRRQSQPGHLGHHLFRCRQRHRRAVDRLAEPAARAVAAVHRFGAAVHPGIAAVRPRRQPGGAARMPCLSGSGGGADDPAVAGAAVAELPEGESRHGDRHVVDDDGGRAGDGAGARRLADRQPVLAVDLLHQRAVRPGLRLADLAGAARAGVADAQAAGRFRRPGAAGDLGRRHADHAGQGQGTRLVQLKRNRFSRVRGRRRLHFLPDLGTDRGAADRRSDVVSWQEFHRGVDRDHPGLRGVLRQRRADTDVAATIHGLHRDLGGAGDGARRVLCADALAVGRAADGPHRPTGLRHGIVPGLRRLRLLARRASARMSIRGPLRRPICFRASRWRRSSSR